MITLGKISADFDTYGYDEVWIVARSIRSIPDLTSYSNVFHMIDLAPSEELLEYYKRMVEGKCWSKEIFDNNYVPRYMKELENNANAQDLLKQLLREEKFKNISLRCFCEDETLCHRSVIASILNDHNASINSPNYKKYSLMLE